MSNLITTKFSVPGLPSTLVNRPYVLERLKLLPTTKLVLISAPAGSGKSTLLGQWLVRQDQRAAWLSLEASENDLERFLLYLVSALQQVEPKLGAGLEDVLQSQSSVQAESIIIRLINDSSYLNQNTCLVLDDYHVVLNPQIHDAVEFLLDHLPPQLCLVIATRMDPPLAVSRLRGRGQLIEIRADALRFTLQETASFLNDQFNLELSSKAIACLEEQTEGWIAGLQLAALSLNGRKDKESLVAAFAGSHHYLVDYLMDEVLRNQSKEIRRFLQRTSILERFTASLCQSVSGQPDSQALLEHLSAANLFLIPLDETRTWYRYHHLFAEFLRHRLQIDEGEMLFELHCLASKGFEQGGWLDEAIHHALLAPDFLRAARLVEAIAFNLGVHGNNAQLIKYVERLPLELLPAHPRLCIYYGWALISTGQLDTLTKMLAIFESSRAQTSYTVAACALILRAHQRAWQLDFEGAVKLCQEVLSLREPLEEAALSDEERWLRVAATNLIAYSYLHTDLPQADLFYPTARALSQRLGHLVGVTNCCARHGWVKHRLGQLHAALEIFRQRLGSTETVSEVPDRRVIHVGELHLNLAGLYYEWNRLDEAETQLREARVLNEASQFTPVVAREYETVIYLQAARGDIRAAYASLKVLDRMLGEVHPHNLFYQHHFGVMAMNGRLALVAKAPNLGYLLTEVAGWVRARGVAAHDAFEYPLEGSYSVLARLLLMQGQTHQALGLLERLTEAARAGGRLNDLIRYQALQALSYEVLGQRTRALELLQTAVAVAEPERYCRTFVDLGAQMQTLLKHLAQDQTTTYLHALLEAFPGREHELASPVSTKLGGNVDWREPLHEREQTVLRLLAAGNSNKNIGKILHLSPNTVRWYVSSLLSKLGVKSRLEAVSRARELGLL